MGNRNIIPNDISWISPYFPYLFTTEILFQYHIYFKEYIMEWGFGVF